MSLGRQTIGKYFDFDMLMSSILAGLALITMVAILIYGKI